MLGEIELDAIPSGETRAALRVLAAKIGELEALVVTGIATSDPSMNSGQAPAADPGQVPAVSPGAASGQKAAPKRRRRKPAQAKGDQDEQDKL